MSDQNIGYDIESKDPENEYLHFIQVRGRAKDASNVVLTRNEIAHSANHWINPIPGHFLRAQGEPPM